MIKKTARIMRNAKKMHIEARMAKRLNCRNVQLLRKRKNVRLKCTIDVSIQALML